MLKERVITAVVLVVGLLAAVLFASRDVFAAVIGIVVIAAAWEWTQLAGIKQAFLRILFILVLISFGLLFYRLYPQAQMALLGVSIIWWLTGIAAVVSFPLTARYWSKPLIISAIGWLSLVAGWLAIINLREIGVLYLLWVLLITWGADVGAYFAGRAWGDKKLAPAVSPGKTWAGFFGGMGLSLFVTLMMLHFIPDGFGVVNLIVFSILTLVTVVFSVFGDLVESMMKRQQGIKDSGNLLPGHGGVLDRIDSLMATLPLFALVVMFLLPALN